MEITVTQKFQDKRVHCNNPSITDGVHRNENLVEIILVFSNFFKKKNIYIYKSHFM